MVMLDAALDVRFVTPAAARLFHIAAADLGRNFADFRNPFADIDLRAGARHVVVSGIPLSREVVARSGARYLCRLLPCRGRDDRIDRLVITCSDITEHRRVEQELIAVSEAATEASRDKSRLLAAASHDMRQSLQILLGLHTLLEGQVCNETADKLMARMGVALDSMSGMLNAFLNVDRLEAGARQDLVDLPVDQLLDQLDKEFGHYAAMQGLGWHLVPCRTAVRSDPAMLAEMLRNLITNAIRYTESGKVLVGCRRRGEHLRIEVWDTGIGIAEDELPKIFDEYHRAVRPGGESGFGLGLAIVRRLSRLLDHPVAVRSRLGCGSVFSVEVPLAG